MAWFNAMFGNPIKTAPVMAPVDVNQYQESVARSGGAMNGLDQLTAQQSGSGAIAKQNDLYGQQQMLAQQLQGMANGQGPNPVMGQFQEATRQNMNNQAALMASQRGASVNPALVARQASMQGANIQQSAANQAATLQANQQLGAVGALQNQQSQMANLANTQAGQQIQGAQLYNQATQGEQGLLGQQIQGTNSAEVGSVNGSNSANSGLIGSVIGGIAGAGGSAMAGKHAYGGEIKAMSKGGKVPTSPVLQHLFGCGGMAYSKGGAIPVVGEQLASQGKMVPGEAKVPGNSLKNDVVPAMLSPGEVVIPRSIMSSKDAPKNAAKFVAKILAQHKGKAVPKKKGKA